MKQIIAKLTLSIEDEMLEKTVKFQVVKDPKGYCQLLEHLDSILAPFNQIEQKAKASAERKKFIDWLDKALDC